MSPKSDQHGVTSTNVGRLGSVWRQRHGLDRWRRCRQNKKKNLDSNLLVFFFFIPQIVYKINKSTVGLQTRMSASIEYQPKANNSKYTNYTSSWQQVMFLNHNLSQWGLNSSWSNFCFWYPDWTVTFVIDQRHLHTLACTTPSDD